jgi:Tol biopolymer transport system component
MTMTASAAGAGQIELISRADPLPDSAGLGFVSALSADGRWVLFQSEAPNLIPGQVDSNGFFDVFLRDRVAGTTTLISHEAGKPATASFAEGQWSSLDGGLSADGRYAVFVSLGTRLVPGENDANHASDVFLHDRVTGTTTLISHAAGDPATTADGLSAGAAISSDGGFIVFVSTAGNLVAGQTTTAGFRKANVFLYSRATGALTLLSRATGTPAATGNDTSAGPVISADGAWVAFWSAATNLMGGVTNAGTAANVFLWQRATGTLSLVSHASGSTTTPGHGFSSDPQISADGRWISFFSQARDLVAGQTASPGAAADNLYLFDRVSGQTRLVSHASGSPLIAAGTGDSEFAGGFSMSADGRFVAFTSAASNLVAGQTNLAPGNNVFLYDRVADASALASHNRDSQTTSPAHPSSRLPSVSADGRYVAYESAAADLVPHQTDDAGGVDVFVYDRAARASVLASHVRTSLTTAADGPSGFARISADGGTVAFDSHADDLGPGQADPQGFQDVFLFNRKSAEVTALTGRDPDLPSMAPFGPSSPAGISADGRYVLFTSKATGLVPGQVDKPWHDASFGGESGSVFGTWDLFLRDRATGKATLLSRSAASALTAAGTLATQGGPPLLSADGQVATFAETQSTSYAPEKVYLYDLKADRLTLVNHRPGAPGQTDGMASPAALSADGRWLAYTCGGCHPPGGGDAVSGLFLYDRVTGQSTLVDHAAGAPGTGGGGESSDVRLSADGRFLLFISTALGLVPGQAGAGRRNVFLYDQTTGALTLVSHAAGSSTTGGSADSWHAEMSADGRWIAFSSGAADLIPGQVDADLRSDVFLYDRLSGATVLVSHAAASAAAGDGASGDLDPGIALSADGRFLAFLSLAGDLVPGLVNPSRNVAVYLYDRLSGGTTLVSHALGAPATVANSGSFKLALSADGGRIAFATYATDVAPGQSAASQSVDLILWERATGTATRIGRTFPARPFGYESVISLSPFLSANGLQVAFISDAALVAGDFNDIWDAYLWNAAGGPVTVPPCVMLDEVLPSNAQRTIVVSPSSCGVPAGAKQVQVKLTVSQGTGQGNVRIFPGNASSPPSGILRFIRGATRSAGFTVPLGDGAVAVLPFVAGNGTVRLNLEIDGYVP